MKRSQDFVGIESESKSKTEDASLTLLENQKLLSKKLNLVKFTWKQQKNKDNDDSTPATQPQRQQKQQQLKFREVVKQEKTTEKQPSQKQMQQEGDKNQPLFQLSQDENPQQQEMLIQQQNEMMQYNEYCQQYYQQYQQYKIYHDQQQQQLYQIQMQQYYQQQKQQKDEQQQPKQEEQEPKQQQQEQSSPEFAAIEMPSSQSKIPEQSQSAPTFSTPIENVMEIPEVFRSNFGASECAELVENPIARQFWYDSENALTTKFFIKLHGDGSPTETEGAEAWKNTKAFILIEQIGLQNPTTHLLKYQELLDKLEKTPASEMRIWLDVRSFNHIFFHPENVLPPQILSSVTHFSLGSPTETEPESRNVSGSHEERPLEFYLLLEFLNNHLGNLEFCSINNSQLWKNVHSDQQPRFRSGRAEMGKVKSLIFVHDNPIFPAALIILLLNACPNLENIFNFPLHLLSIIGECDGVVKLRGAIKSFYVKRDIYYADARHGHGVFNFINHLSFLHGLNQYNFLQDLDCRTFFLECYKSGHGPGLGPGMGPGPENLYICSNYLSQTLSMNLNSLRLLKIQPISPASTFIALPQVPMVNLTTLQFYMTRHVDASNWSIFPTGFHPALFPNLSTVEIIMDYSSWPRKIKRRTCPPAFLFWKHFSPSIFQPGVSFNSVTSLKLHGFNVLGCMRSIAELFPNLLILRLQDQLENVVRVLPSCYKFGFWPGLKQLHLNVDVDTTSGNLDAALLGTRDNMGDILRKGNGEFDEEEIKRVASNSICQLKELEFLKIVLRASENVGASDVNQLPILTEISAVVLSQFQGRLKVQIAFDESVDVIEKKRIRSSLSPLESFPSLFLPIL